MVVVTYFAYVHHYNFFYHSICSRHNFSCVQANDRMVVFSKTVSFLMCVVFLSSVSLNLDCLDVIRRGMRDIFIFRMQTNVCAFGKSKKYIYDVTSHVALSLQKERVTIIAFIEEVKEDEEKYQQTITITTNHTIETVYQTVCAERK